MDDAPPISTLFGLWPHDEPPLEEQLRIRLDRWVRVPDEDGLAGPPGNVLWSGMWHRPGDFAPIVATVMPADFLDDLRFVLQMLDHPDADLLESAHWAFGLSCVLDPERPLEAFRDQLALLRELCPEAIAVFDADAQRLRSIPDVDRLASSALLTPDDLYMTHAVHDEEPEPHGLWMHTHGLPRVGFPDLEILGVPPDLVEAGLQLIRQYVGCFLHVGLPPEEAPEEVVCGHSVAWRQLDREVVDEDAPWSFAQRSPQHLRDRIVLVRPHSARKGRPWGPPLDALRAFAFDDEPVVYMSEDQRLRLARQALEAWGRFGMLFVDKNREADWQFLVCIAVDCGEHGCEHLWFEAEALRPGGIRGRLLSAPLHDVGLAPGDRAWYALDDLVTWAIDSPDGTIRPGSSLTLPRSG